MINELIKDTSEKIRLEPDNIELIRLRAVLYGAANLYDLALGDLNNLVAVLPSDPEAYYLRSDCHFHREEYDLAQQDYLRAIKVEYNDSENESDPAQTLQIISQAKIKNKDEIEALKTILEFETKKAALRLFPMEQKNN